MTPSFEENSPPLDKPKRKRQPGFLRMSYSVPLPVIVAACFIMGMLALSLLQISGTPPEPLSDYELLLTPQYIRITTTPGQFTAPNTYRTWINNPGIPTPGALTPEAQETAFIPTVPDCSALPATVGGKFVFRHTLPDNFELFRIDADGKNLCRLTHNTKLDDYPAWSPDGKQIAFVSDTDGYGIYLMDSDGTNRRQIFSQGDAFSFPAWSPDGKQIIFQATIKGLFDLYIINADGSGLRNLTADLRLDTMPDWSPDGHTIVFASDRAFNPAGINLLPQDASYDIYVTNADDGRNTLRLTNNLDSDDSPAWSPDGEHIAFAAQYLYSMNKDGSDLKEYRSGCDSPVWMSNETIACLSANTLMTVRLEAERAEWHVIVKFPTRYGYFSYLDYTPGQS